MSVHVFKSGIMGCSKVRFIVLVPDFEDAEMADDDSGPYAFDVSGVPPAPSRLGRIEVERLVHAYRLTGSQMEVDPEFIKRLVAFHRGYMVLPRFQFSTLMFLVK